jgi:hypothetical protein
MNFRECTFRRPKLPFLIATSRLRTRNILLIPRYSKTFLPRRTHTTMMNLRSSKFQRCTTHKLWSRLVDIDKDNRIITKHHRLHLSMNHSIEMGHFDFAVLLCSVHCSEEREGLENSNP